MPGSMYLCFFPSRKKPLAQAFPGLEFFLFPLKCFDNRWTKDFLSFLFFTAMVYCLRLSLCDITSTELEKNFLIKDKELGTECSQLVGMLWQQTLGNELGAIKFRHPRRWMSSPQWEPSLGCANLALFSLFDRLFRAMFIDTNFPPLVIRLIDEMSQDLKNATSKHLLTHCALCWSLLIF